MAAVVGGPVHRTKYPSRSRRNRAMLSISTTKPGWTPPTSAAAPATETPAKPTIDQTFVVPVADDEEIDR